MYSFGGEKGNMVKFMFLIRQSSILAIISALNLVSSVSL